MSNCNSSSTTTSCTPIVCGQCGPDAYLVTPEAQSAQLIPTAYTGDEDRIYPEDPILLVTSGNPPTYDGCPIDLDGSLDIETFAIAPRCGTHSLYIMIDPEDAVGTVALGGLVVWVSASETSTPKFVQVEYDGSPITYQINLSDGAVAIYYHGDVTNWNSLLDVPCIETSSGAGAASIYTAGENINGHRAVFIDTDGLLYAADSAAEEPAIGVIRDSVTTGNQVTVYGEGSIVTGFSGLSTGLIYHLSTNGTLVTPPPSAPELKQQIGVATSATVMRIDLGIPIEQE